MSIRALDLLKDSQGYVLGRTLDVSLAQSKSTSISPIGWRARSIGVFNPTPFYIHFPDAPAAFAWVQPNTQNAVIPIPVGTDSVRVNSIDLPAGFPTPITSSQTASLTAFEAVLPPSTGAPISTSPSLIPTQAKTIDQALGISASAVLIAPAAGQSIYLFEFEGMLDAAVAAGWYKFRNATDSTDIGPEFGTATGVTPHRYSFGGLSLPAGKALGLLNSAAGAIQLRGGLTYNQA